MNKDKIREAAGKIWLNATSHGTEEPYSTLSKIILAELDKAQQPGKALTDEEIERVAQHVWTANGWDGGVGFAEGNLLINGLRYARDNYGIGSPAAGLTVEELTGVFIAFSEKWFAYKRTGDESVRGIWNDLRARLTAAIEAKYAKP